MCGCQGSSNVWQGGAQTPAGQPLGTPAVTPGGGRVMPHARRTGPTFHTVQDAPPPPRKQ